MPRTRAAVGASAVLVWTVGVAIVALDVVYPGIPDGWPSVGAQALAYLITVTPLLLVLRRPRPPLGVSARVIVASLVVLASAIVFAAVTQPVSPESHLRRAIDALTAGVTEEVVFRGLLRDRVAVLIPRRLAQVPVVALLFALYHLPLALRNGDGSALGPPLALGIVFGLARELSKGLALPAALHVAVDLTG